MTLRQIISDTTGWVATYRIKDQEDAELQFIPILGWGLYESGDVLALVPSNDGRAVPCGDYLGMDGELIFDSLTCNHGRDHAGEES